MDNNLTPVLLVTMFLGLGYLALRAHQMHLQHQQRLAALDKGVDIKPIVLQATPAFAHLAYLLRGLVWLCAGVALAGVLAVTSPIFESRDSGPAGRLESKLQRSRTLKDMGATPEQIAAMELEIAQAERRHVPPPNLAIIGLIPMSIGLAYLIFFGIEERRVRRGGAPA